MSTIAAREAAANIGASLSPALAKEAERKREAAERRANRNKVQARKDELVSFYLERQREWMREEAFDPKFNFPDVHGKPVDTSARGWKRDLDQRHMVTDDDHHQLKHHTCVYKFKDRVGGGGGGKSGAETATDDSDTDGWLYRNDAGSDGLAGNGGQGGARSGRRRSNKAAWRCLFNGGRRCGFPRL